MFIPHDSRDSVNDKNLLATVNDRVPENIKKHTKIVNELVDTWDIAQLIDGLDLAVSGRMHFSIACLRAGVPSLTVDYQGKVQGLYHFFNMEEFVVQPEELLAVKDLAMRILRILNVKDSYRLKISNKLPSILRLAAANFSFISRKSIS